MRFVLVSLMIAAIAITGCATTETKIVSSPDGTFLVIAKAYNESRAMDGAREAAAAHCKKMGKGVVIIDKNEMQKTAARQPQRARGANNERDRQHNLPGDASPDSEISLVFKCR